MRIAIKATIRVILIYIFLSSLVSLISYGVNIFNSHHFYPEDYGFLFTLALLILGMVLITLILLALWWKTDWIVGIIAGDIPENEIKISTTNLDLIKVAMRILGIFLLVYSIPTLVGLIGYHFSLPADSPDFPSVHADEIRNLLVAGVKIVFGVWLLLGTRGIMNTVDKVWDKAHMVRDEEKTPEE